MESGANAWEIRALARKIDVETLDGIAMKDEFHDRVYDPNPYRDAILIEALECLALKKEKERDELLFNN